MNDYLAKARTYCQDVALTSEPGIRITWLTVICEQIINHLELSESAKPATDHLIAAREAVSSASLAPGVGWAITRLTDACKQILNHLEAQPGDNKLPQGEMDERPDPVTDPKLQKLLDQTRFGDILSITNGRGKHLSDLSGPVLSDQTHDPCVSIDLLDGEPYIVRNEAGTVLAPISYAALYRDGGLVAVWDEDADH